MPKPSHTPDARNKLKARRRKNHRDRILGIVLIAVVVALVAAGAWFAHQQRTAPPRQYVTSATQPPPTAQATAVATAEATLAATAEPTPPPTAPPATQKPGLDPVDETFPPPETDDLLRSVRFRATGDIMVTSDQLRYAQTAGGYDFHSQLARIRESLRDADYTMGNLETTVGQYKDVRYSGYPQFNSPEVLLDALEDSGYDFFTLANNHMLDRWFDGLKKTVNLVEQHGFSHVGAYRTEEERRTPTLVEIGGIRFGFVAYTFSTNTMEETSNSAVREYGVPYLYSANIPRDIKRLREAGAEVVIAFPHWGTEYVRTPDDNQKKYAQVLADAGADIILGSHTHTVQPMNYLNATVDGQPKRVFIIYSLGNFLSTHSKRYTDSGIILEFTVRETADGTFACEDVGYIPTYCWIHDNDVQVVSSAKYLDNPPEGMSPKAYARMKETYAETTGLLDSQFRVLTE